MSRKLLLLGLLLLCASCAAFTPRDVGKANMLSLDAVETHPAATSKARLPLMIAYPAASPELDTYRIAVERADRREDYFAGSRWNEFLPSLVQQALKETLSRSGIFSHVEADENKMDTGYRLLTSITRFKAVYAKADSAPRIAIAMTFTLKKAHRAAIVKEFTMESSVQANENSIPAIAAGFNAAFGDIERQLVKKLSWRK